jgi:hypothetical protein
MPRSLVDRCVRMLTEFFSILEMSLLILLSLFLVLFMLGFKKGIAMYAEVIQMHYSIIRLFVLYLFGLGFMNLHKS